MKNLSLLFAFFLIILTIFCGCLEEDNLNSNGLQELEGLDYINKEMMYGFNLMEGFYLKEESYFKQYVLFEYVPNEDESGQLSLNIYASNISANISLPSRSIKEIARDLQESLVNSTTYRLYLISYNFKTINGMDFYEILFESPLSQINDNSIFWKYIYVLKDERMINFQVIGSSNLFVKYSNLINQSLNSLVVLKIGEEEWDLEKFYSQENGSIKKYVVSAREHYEDRSIIIYFSKINVFFKSSNTGDTIVTQDKISNIYYDEISNATTVSFSWDNNGLVEYLHFLFEGNITNDFSIGDQVNITVTLKRVIFSYKDINYDLELYAESWISEEYFKENIVIPSNINKALKPLASYQIQKI